MCTTCGCHVRCFSERDRDNAQCRRTDAAQCVNDTFPAPFCVRQDATRSVHLYLAVEALPRHYAADDIAFLLLHGVVPQWLAMTCSKSANLEVGLTAQNRSSPLYTHLAAPMWAIWARRMVPWRWTGEGLSLLSLTLVQLPGTECKGCYTVRQHKFL